MKTIIAGTDFSPSSANACRYAAMLAQQLQCKLVIFNLFQAPILHSNSGLYGISFVSVKKTSEKKSKEMVQALHKDFPSLKIDTFVTTGGFEEELLLFMSRHQVQAVVMGLEAKNRIAKFIWGSHGVSIAGKLNAPAIIVPERYKHHRMASLLIAVDNTDKLKSSSLKEVEKFAKGAETQLKLLHVRTPEELISPVTRMGLKINKQRYELEFQRARTIEEGIRAYCRNTAIDLVVVISRKHSIFYNLFNESVTKRVAFASKVPVMAIHE